MLSLFARRPPPLPRVEFTLRYRVRTEGAEMDRTLYVTETYVVTRMGPTTLIFRPGREERYVVDAERRRLRRLDLSAQRAQAERLRAALGPARVSAVPAGEVGEGFACTRYTLWAEGERARASAGVLAMRLPGVEATALHAERELGRRHAAFALPLRPGEVVVRARSRLVAGGVEQLHREELAELEDRIAGREELDEHLAFPVAG